VGVEGHAAGAHVVGEGEGAAQLGGAGALGLVGRMGFRGLDGVWWVGWVW